MKKFLPTLILIFFNSISISAQIFSDVNIEHSNFNAINYLYSKSIIKGYNDNIFHPEKEIYRAELLKMILEGNKTKITDLKTNCFSDVGYLEWYSPYICSALSLKYINGYDDGSFRPNQAINKAEALKIIGKIYNWQMEFEETPGAFADTPYDAWYIDYVLYGIERDLFKDFDNEFINLSEYQFEPGKSVTRGEVAEILYRYLVLEELKEYSFSPSLEKTIQKKLTKEKKNEKKISTVTTFTNPPTFAGGEIKIILSWKILEKLNKNNPKIDLDSHLIETYHDNNKESVTEEIDFLYKLNKSLDIILETKENTETITIRKLKSPADYEYFIYNFSGNKNFSDLKAKVQIYDKNGLAKFYEAPSGSGKIWKIFELKENGEILDFNQTGKCNLIKNISIICPKEL